MSSAHFRTPSNCPIIFFWDYCTRYKGTEGAFSRVSTLQVPGYLCPANSTRAPTRETIPGYPPWKSMSRGSGTRVPRIVHFCIFYLIHSCRDEQIAPWDRHKTQVTGWENIDKSRCRSSIDHVDPIFAVQRY